MCMLKLQKTLILHVDKLRHLCLWRKDDLNTHPNSLAAWHMVCRPKLKGGLGIIDLELQNEALLLKHLFPLVNKDNKPWVEMIWHAYYQTDLPQVMSRVGSFWWWDICSLMETFQGVAGCLPGYGSSVLLWKDNWSAEILSDKYPQLSHLPLILMLV